MSVALIAIKGNHFDKTDQIFAALDYVDTRVDKQFETFPEFESYIYENYNDFALNGTFLRGMWMDNGWTVFLDPDMADPVHKECLAGISEKLNAEVCGLVIEPTANAFVYSYFTPQQQRYFLIDNFDVKENSGEPLPQEAGLNINESVAEKDLIALAHQLGFQTEPKDLKTKFIIKELNHTEAFKKEMEKFAPVISQRKPAEPKKAWWKFW